MQPQSQTMTTTQIFNISDTSTTGGMSPYQKYPVGYKFNMLDWDGSIMEIEVKKYLPASKEFIINRPLHDVVIQDKMSLLKLEEFTDPHLAKYPVGTNVNVPLSNKTVTTGKMAGYSKSNDKYIVHLPAEKNGKIKKIEIEPKILDAINFRGRVKELLQ